MLIDTLLKWIIYNHKKKEFKLVGLGLLLNGLVVLFNGGIMPYDGTLIAHLGYNETYLSMEREQAFGHYQTTEQAKLSFLSDAIHLPPPYPYPKAVGFGTLLMGFGIVVQLAFFKTSRQVRAPTIQGGCII